MAESATFAHGYNNLLHASRTGIYLRRANLQCISQPRAFGKTWDEPILAVRDPHSLAEWNGGFAFSDEDRSRIPGQYLPVLFHDFAAGTTEPLDEGLPRDFDVDLFTDGKVLMATQSDDFYR